MYVEFFLHEFGMDLLYSIYIVTGETRCAGCLCTSSGCFKHTEPLLATSLRWFKHIESPPTCTELFLTTSLQGKEGEQGAYAVDRGGSSTPNLLELSQST